MGISGKNDVSFEKFFESFQELLTCQTFSRLRLRVSYCVRMTETFKKFVFWENNWNCLEKISAIFQKRFFRQRFYRMGLNWYYYLRILKKLEFWGLLQNYMGVFGKKFHSFQNRFNWQSFVVWFFNILTVKMLKISQEFLTFFSLSCKNRRVFWKSLNFFKNWCIFQICSRRRPIFL